MLPRPKLRWENGVKIKPPTFRSAFNSGQITKGYWEGPRKLRKPRFKKYSRAAAYQKMKDSIAGLKKNYEKNVDDAKKKIWAKKSERSGPLWFSHTYEQRFAKARKKADILRKGLDHWAPLKRKLTLSTLCTYTVHRLATQPDLFPGIEEKLESIKRIRKDKTILSKSAGGETKKKEKGKKEKKEKKGKGAKVVAAVTPDAAPPPPAPEATTPPPAEASPTAEAPTA